ncbi:hypothetical protein Mal64_09330 [Pseudobythopirellula maris]|uniref:Lnb N-terminal periplasmic domain-containing protein n=1 Tax=Pseudobythopirellula maris TaxID=2527991 RepID=A0A5C5ZUF6_9BACT|nr:DUF4105 domain-containing protein [Pseudobythopirellula maris]TWT90541.1 hypothetical protein Mal64_09330 [Pseudobythopirellula maris]
MAHVPQQTAAHSASRRRAACCVLLVWAMAVSLAGCQSAEKRLVASNHRDWTPDLAVLPTADFEGDTVEVHNVRYCKYYSPTEYVVDHYDKRFDLSRVQAVDFISMPFGPVPMLAHTLLSFEFAPAEPGGDPEHLAVSVEVRKEKGEEKFNPLLGLARQYEITYVVADERDLLDRQVNAYDMPTYVYRTVAEPADARALLVDMLERANELSEKPEFYDLLTNNCTTNLADHVNELKPSRITYDIGVLLPGLSARKAYAERLLPRDKPFEELEAEALINDRARLAAGSEDFSKAIRR